VTKTFDLLCLSLSALKIAVSERCKILFFYPNRDVLSLAAMNTHKRPLFVSPLMGMRDL